MKIYAFDVDDTLDVSKGPIPFSAVEGLWAQGHIVGICGNWAPFVQSTPNWHRIVSFLTPIPGEGRKVEWLKTLKKLITADEYIMVGNILGVTGSSDDKRAAEKAGWRFILEKDFAEGER